MGLINPRDKDKISALVESTIAAPYKKAQVSTLGGAERASLIIHFSLDRKETWANGIIHNSRYAIVHLDHRGELEMSHRGFAFGAKKKMRKSKVKSVDEALQKINKWIGS